MFLSSGFSFYWDLHFPVSSISSISSSSFLSLNRHVFKKDESHFSLLEVAKMSQWIEVEEQASLVESDLVPFQVLVAKMSSNQQPVVCYLLIPPPLVSLSVVTH
jgi:hypothetical protein